MRTYNEEAPILISHEGFSSVDSMLEHLAYDSDEEYVFDEYKDVYNTDD